MARADVAQRIRAGRKALRLTVAEAAEAVGVSRQTWTSWERIGGYDPGAEYLPALSAVLQQTVDWIVRGATPAEATAEPEAPKVRPRTVERMYLDVLQEASQTMGQYLTRAKTSPQRERVRRQMCSSLETLIALAHSWTAPWRSEYHAASRAVDMAALFALHHWAIAQVFDGTLTVTAALDIERHYDQVGSIVDSLRISGARRSESASNTVEWIGEDRRALLRIVVC